MKKTGRRFASFAPIFVTLASVTLFSCRGQKSTEPPIVLMRNMVDQTSYAPQSPNDFYTDKRATRPAVEGTIAIGEAKTNTRLYLGQESNSTPQKPVWVKQIPIQLSIKTLQRGQAQFNIYCAPCHGYAANNDGLATQHANGSIRPANLHDDERVNLPVGKIFDAVTHGVNNWNMPGFSEQLDATDRWAIVAYVRALQYSQRAKKIDIPSDIQKKWSHP